MHTQHAKQVRIWPVTALVLVFKRARNTEQYFIGITAFVEDITSSLRATLVHTPNGLKSLDSRQSLVVCEIVVRFCVTDDEMILFARKDDGQALNPKFEHEGGRVDERFNTATARAGIVVCTLEFG